MGAKKAPWEGGGLGRTPWGYYIFGLGKNMKMTPFCVHAQWWSPWRRKHVEKRHLGDLASLIAGPIEAILVIFGRRALIFFFVWKLYLSPKANFLWKLQRKLLNSLQENILIRDFPGLCIHLMSSCWLCRSISSIKFLSAVGNLWPGLLWRVQSGYLCGGVRRLWRQTTFNNVKEWRMANYVSGGCGQWHTLHHYYWRSDIWCPSQKNACILQVW